jgi:hypothetical protein
MTQPVLPGEDDVSGSSRDCSREGNGSPVLNLAAPQGNRYDWIKEKTAKP